jgi:hypothetical protein
LTPLYLGRTGKEATNMVRWIRSARIKYVNFNQGVQWAKEVAEFVNKKYKIQVSVYMVSFGEFATIRWFCDYKDLATLEKLAGQILVDKEYMQIVGKGTEFLVPDSVLDTVMRAIAI